MSDGIKRIKPLLLGEKLNQELADYPDYSPEDRNLPAEERLEKIGKIRYLFYPTQASKEIYLQVYKMVSDGLDQKGGWGEIGAAYATHAQVQSPRTFKPVSTGMSSATVIGESGIGKSAALNRCIDLIGKPYVIDKPFRKIIPILVVNTPFDCSHKSLMLQILAEVDNAIGTNYSRGISPSITANGLIGIVSQVCRNHVGLLVLDEIQFIVQHKAGGQLYRFLMEIINTSCNVLLVGTPECIPFFTQGDSAYQFARRSVGLQFKNMEFNDEFANICKTILQFNYLQNDINITDSLINWLYQHSRGNISVLVALIALGQEYALVYGDETFSISVLETVYDKQFEIIKPLITSQTSNKKRSKRKKVLPATGGDSGLEKSLMTIESEASGSVQDFLTLLEGYYHVERITI